MHVEVAVSENQRRFLRHGVHWTVMWSVYRHLPGQLSADCLYFPQQWYPSWRQLQQMLVTLHCSYQAAPISAYMLGERLQQESHLWLQEQTRSSAIAEGPRDTSCQLKSCQLPRNSAVRQVLNKSKLWTWRVKVGRYVVNMCTQPWPVRVAFIVL